MKTFTLNNGHTYTRQENGYCFATINGKKIRCGKDTFESAYGQYVREENERQNATNEFVNINPIEAKERELDEAAENPEVTLEQYVQMVQDAEESATTEEIKEIQKEMAPKKERKPRKRKDTAYEGHDITLTAKQVDFIRHLPDTYFWENGLDSVIWVDCLCDDIKGQFAGKPMTVGAMISTICEKGLGFRTKDRVNNRKCTGFGLTELGQQVAKELGLS